MGAAAANTENFRHGITGRMEQLNYSGRFGSSTSDCTSQMRPQYQQHRLFVSNIYIKHPNVPVQG